MPQNECLTAQDWLARFQRNEGRFNGCSEYPSEFSHILSLSTSPNSHAITSSTGSDDEEEGLSIQALRALGDALAHNQPIADINLHGKQLTDEHLAAFVDGLATNQHLRIVGLGGL